MEFIAAKDLPVLEAESPDVLAVDPATGEMGRVPGANLGGGGSFEVNITLGDTSWGNPSSVSFDKSYAEIKEAIDKGLSVIGWVYSSQFTGSDRYHYQGGYMRFALPKYAEVNGEEYIFFLPAYIGYACYWLKADNTTGYESD